MKGYSTRIGTNYTRIDTNNEKATILLVTLWLLAILSLLAIGIGFRTSIDLRLVSYQVDKLKAYEMAKAGIAKVISELEKDETPNTDTLWKCGITLGENETFDKKFKNIEMGEVRFDISYVEDIERKININTATEDVLKTLFLKTPDVAKNILAWRGSISASIGDYSDKPYACKGDFFDSVNELLLVKDFKPETFFGKDDEMGIKNLVTIYPKSKGPNVFKININTANQEVLGIILDSVGFEMAIADEIANARVGPDGNITAKLANRIFENPTQVIDFIKGFLPTAEGGGIYAEDQNKLNDLQPLIVCSSSYFQICSTGTLTGRKSNIHKTITCIVNRDLSSATSKTEIISWVED